MTNDATQGEDEGEDEKDRGTADREEQPAKPAQPAGSQTGKDGKSSVELPKPEQPSADVAGLLGKLQDVAGLLLLKQAGIIDEDEFQELKRKALGLRRKPRANLNE